MRGWAYWKQRGWRWLLFGAVMTATITLATWLLLSNLYRFLSFDPQFYAIFAQIADAPMVPPVLPVLILSCLYCLLGSRLATKGKGGRLTAVLVGIPVWLFLLIGSILLTKVNHILFHFFCSRLICSRLSSFHSLNLFHYFFHIKTCEEDLRFLNYFAAVRIQTKLIHFSKCSLCSI